MLQQIKMIDFSNNAIHITPPRTQTFKFDFTVPVGINCMIFQINISASQNADEISGTQLEEGKHEDHVIDLS